MELAIYGITIVSFVILLIVKKTEKKQLSKREYIRKQGVMSDNERDFFYHLSQITHDSFHIFSMVRIADIVKPVNGKGWQSRFNKICAKHVDFLIIDKTKYCKTIVAIELDDRSHNSQKRIDRDLIVNKVFKDAKIPLVRIKAKQKYSSEYITKNLISKL